LEDLLKDQPCQPGRARQKEIMKKKRRRKQKSKKRIMNKKKKKRPLICELEAITHTDISETHTTIITHGRR
jgi:hypothetical protein